MEALRNLCEGRISKRKYCVRTIIAAIVFALFSILFYEISFLTTITYFLLIAYLVPNTIKRLHDIGYDWKLALLMVFPGLCLFLVVYLMLKRGNPEENLYGPVPAM